jgi:hypothetical protein
VGAVIASAEQAVGALKLHRRQLRESAMNAFAPDLFRPLPTRLILAMVAAAVMLGSALAAPDEARDRHQARSADRSRPAAESRWFDGAHGHSHYYPTPGWRVRELPQRRHMVIWAGVNYSFWDGVWYAPGSGGYVVVRPPYGVVVTDLPTFRTLVTIGGLSYFYLNGVYYRQHGENGYEVVPTPIASGVDNTVATAKVFVYPRQAQSPEKQASDEYDCHRWAAAQAGFDPTSVATGQMTDVGKRGDYQRAQAACLEGRGYTVR